MSDPEALLSAQTLAETKSDDEEEDIAVTTNTKSKQEKPFKQKIIKKGKTNSKTKSTQPDIKLDNNNNKNGNKNKKEKIRNKNEDNGGTYVLNPNYEYGGDTDYVSILSRDHIAHFIWSHDFLTGRYLTDDGTVQIASHRMFELKDNFIKTDLMADSIKKFQSNVLTSNSLETKLAKSSYTSLSVQTQMQSFAWAPATVDVSGGISSHSNTDTNVTGKATQKKVIKSTNFQRARVNISQESVRYTPAFNKDFDKYMKLSEQHRNEPETRAEIWKQFTKKWGDFFISEAFVGGKILYESAATTDDRSRSYDKSKTFNANGKVGVDAPGIAGGSITTTGKDEQQLNSNKASSRSSDNSSLQCIGGEPSTVDENDLSSWEDTLKLHQNWVNIETTQVMEWHAWRDLTNDQLELIPKRSRNQRNLRDERLSQNNFYSVKVSQFNEKLGYLCSEPDKNKIYLRSSAGEMDTDTLYVKPIPVRSSGINSEEIDPSTLWRLMVYSSDKYRRRWIKVNRNNRLSVTRIDDNGSYRLRRENIDDATVFQLIQVSKFNYRMVAIKKYEWEDNISSGCLSTLKMCLSCCNCCDSSEEPLLHEAFDKEWVGIDIEEGLENKQGSHPVYLKTLDDELAFEMSVILTLDRISPKIDIKTSPIYSIRCYKNFDKFIGYMSEEQQIIKDENIHNDHNGIISLATANFKTALDSYFKFTLVEKKQYGENAFFITDVFDQDKNKIQYLKMGRLGGKFILELETEEAFKHESNYVSTVQNIEEKYDHDEDLGGDDNILSVTNNDNQLQVIGKNHSLEDLDDEGEGFYVWSLLELGENRYLLKNFATKLWVAYELNNDRYLLVGKESNQNNAVISIYIEPNSVNEPKNMANLPNKPVANIKQKNRLKLDKPELKIIKEYATKIDIWCRKAYESRYSKPKYVRIKCGPRSHDFLIKERNIYTLTHIPPSFEPVRVTAKLLDESKKIISEKNEIFVTLAHPRHLVVSESNIQAKTMAELQKQLSVPKSLDSPVVSNGYIINQKNHTIKIFGGDESSSDLWINLLKPSLLGPWQLPFKIEFVMKFDEPIDKFNQYWIRHGGIHFGFDKSRPRTTRWESDSRTIETGAKAIVIDHLEKFKPDILKYTVKPRLYGTSKYKQKQVSNLKYPSKQTSRHLFVLNENDTIEDDDKNDETDSNNKDNINNNNNNVIDIGSKRSSILSNKPLEDTRVKSMFSRYSQSRHSKVRIQLRWKQTSLKEIADMISFDDIDEDGDLTISRDEFRLKFLGIASNQFLDDVFTSIDTDNDNEISLEEFNIWKTFRPRGTASFVPRPASTTDDDNQQTFLSRLPSTQLGKPQAVDEKLMVKSYYGVFEIDGQEVCEFIPVNVNGGIGFWKWFESPTMTISNLVVKSLKRSKSTGINVFSSTMLPQALDSLKLFKPKYSDDDDDHENEDDNKMDNDIHNDYPTIRRYLEIRNKSLEFGRIGDNKWEYVNLKYPRLLGFPELPFSLSFNVSARKGTRPNLNEYCFFVLYFGFDIYKTLNDDFDPFGKHIIRGLTTIQWDDFGHNKGFKIGDALHDHHHRLSYRSSTYQSIKDNPQRIKRRGYQEFVNFEWNPFGKWEIKFVFNETLNKVEGKLHIRDKYLFTIDPYNVDGSIGFGTRNQSIVKFSDIDVRKIRNDDIDNDESSYAE